MIVLIPALIEQDEAVRLLRVTLSKLASTSEITLAVITHGRYPFHLEPPPGVKEFRHRNLPNRTGKWSAIRFGLELVSDMKDDPLLLLDADDPVPTRTLTRAFERMDRGNVDYLIGDRVTISLPAVDKLSEHTRAFVEIFSNTLLLQILGGARAADGPAPDIQSGFYILSPRARQYVNFNYVADYGGDLALYHELISNGVNATPFEIETNSQESSNYTVRGILQSMARLPFFQSVSAEDLGRALKSAPVLYSRYLKGDLAVSFHREMEGLALIRHPM